MKLAQLVIDGMSCGGCVRNVRRLLESVAGVEVEDVKIGSVTLQSNADDEGVQAAIQTLARGGYRSRQVEQASPNTK